MPLVDDERFHAERRTALTSTDIPKILGLSSYGTPRTVYLDKVDPLPLRPMSVSARLGLELEPALGRLFTEDTGKRVRRLNRFYRAPGREHIACHADFSVVGERSLLECKTRRDDRGWGPAMTGVVPVDVWIQCQIEMLCLKMTRAYVAVLFGFGQYRTMKVERDEDFLEGALQTADRFWHDNVLAGVMPDMVFGDLPALAEAFPRETDDVLRSAPPDIDVLIQRYAVAREERLEAERKEDTLKARLQKFIGEHAGVTGPSGTVTWKVDDPDPQFDPERFADLLAELATDLGASDAEVTNLRAMSHSVRDPQRRFHWRRA